MFALDMKSNMAALGSDLNMQASRNRTAAQRALNVAARGRVTDAGRALRERYPSLKRKDALDAFKVVFSTKESLTAVVSARARRFSLMRFAIRQNAEGVLVRVKEERKTLKHAFIAKGRSFGDGESRNVVFIRVKYLGLGAKSGKSGIVALRTFGIPGALEITEVRTGLDQKTNARFDKEFARQLALLAPKQKGPEGP